MAGVDVDVFVWCGDQWNCWTWNVGVRMYWCVEERCSCVDSSVLALIAWCGGVLRWGVGGCCWRVDVLRALRLSQIVVLLYWLRSFTNGKTIDVLQELRVIVVTDKNLHFLGKLTLFASEKTLFGRLAPLSPIPPPCWHRPGIPPDGRCSVRCDNCKLDRQCFGWVGGRVWHGPIKLLTLKFGPRLRAKNWVSKLGRHPKFLPSRLEAKKKLSSPKMRGFCTFYLTLFGWLQAKHVYKFALRKHWSPNNFFPNINPKINTSNHAQNLFNHTSSRLAFGVLTFGVIPLCWCCICPLKNLGKKEICVRSGWVWKPLGQLSVNTSQCAKEQRAGGGLFLAAGIRAVAADAISPSTACCSCLDTPCEPGLATQPASYDSTFKKILCLPPHTYPHTHTEELNAPTLQWR
jgi:hypothetical protein